MQLKDEVKIKDGEDGTIVQLKDEVKIKNGEIWGLRHSSNLVCNDSIVYSFIHNSLEGLGGV